MNSEDMTHDGCFYNAKQYPDATSYDSLESVRR